MNVSRSKETFTEEEMQELRDRLQAYKDEHGLTWQDLGAQVGVNKTTLSLFAINKYGADNRELAWKVFRFFMAAEAAQQMALQAPDVPSFIKTPTSEAMTRQLTWAHRGRMVVITGNPGVGKTATFKQYLENTPNAVLVTADKTTTGVTSLLLAMLTASGSLSRSGGRAYVLKMHLFDRLRTINPLIIVDEAQHLDDDAVELLRSIHDELECGLVLAGNQEVMRRVQRGARTPAFAQVHSRVSWPQHYAAPTVGDINAILAAWDVTRPDEMEFMRAVAQSGGLRSITQTLEMATLAARASEEDRVLGHLKATYEQRVAPLLKAA